jgi:hypothetical protein
MKLPNRQEFINDLNLINNSEIRDKLIGLYDAYVDVSKDRLDLYERLKDILNLLFNPYGLSTEACVPVSFFSNSIGQLAVAIMYDTSEKTYTVQDLIELSKTASRPGGYSKQYIGQEIKAGKIKATWINGRWEITEIEIKKYLTEKGISKEE